MGYLLLAAPPLAIVLPPQAAHGTTGFDGAAMGWPWAVPFLGILLSIATGPLLFPKIWHGHYGKIVAGWALLTLLLIALIHGGPAMLAAFVHAMLAEYLSFIVLLFTLYTVAGGILVIGSNAWYAMDKHCDAGGRDRNCEHHRNHRRGHDPDPAADSGERGAGAQYARNHLLHHSRRQCRWRAYPAR